MTHSDPADGGAPSTGAPSPGRAGDPDAADLAELLRRSSRGDEQAFAALYDATASRAYGLAVRVVRNPAMAEEVTQEAFLETWRTSARFDAAQGSAVSWLLTIVHRRAVDRVRSEQSHADRVIAHGARHSGDVEHPEQVVEAMDAEWRAARVRRGLAALTPLQREAVELTYYKGYTNRQLAESLEIPLGTAKARNRDAMIRLRDAWEVAR